MEKAQLPYFDDYLLSLRVNNYSDETIYNYERDLEVFTIFLNEEIKKSLMILTSAILTNTKLILTP